MTGGREKYVLERGNDWWKGEICPCLIPFPYLEVVLKESIHDPAHTKGRLNHAGNDLFHMHRLLVSLHRNHILGKRDSGVSKRKRGQPRLQLSLHLGNLVQAESRQLLGDRLGFFLEGFAKRPLVWDDLRHVLRQRLRKFLLSTKSHPSCLAVLS